MVWSKFKCSHYAKTPEVIFARALSGEPEGLRSLYVARLLVRLAKVDQSTLPSLPEVYAHEYIHLKQNVHLARNSVPVTLARLDLKNGKLELLCET